MYRTPKREKHYVPVQQRSYLQLAPQKRKQTSSRNKSPQRSPHESNSSLSKKPHQVQIKSFHFSNCIYQGEVKAYHRVGKGIILHDDGISGIIRSGSNRLKDHNIFFAQNVIISAIYKQHQLDFVVKDKQKILTLRMQRKDRAFVITSPSYFIQFDTHLVSELKFKNDVLIEKLALTFSETQEILKQQKFQKIMKSEHVQALKLNLYDKNFPQIQVIPKYRNQIHIGFTQQNPTTKFYSTTYKTAYGQSESRGTQLQGVGFVIEKITHDVTKHFQYDIHIVQRGFYSKGKLQYFGQQFYQNGSYYFGKLLNEQMHGNGIIVNSSDKKFVYGNFKDGKPVKLDQNRSYRLDTQQGKQIYMNLRKNLHSQDPQVWIDCQVNDMPNLEYFKQKIQQCTYFLYEDKQVRNYRKAQQNLQLSRKVEDILSNSKYSRSSYGLNSIESKRSMNGPLLEAAPIIQDNIRKRLFTNDSSSPSRIHESNLNPFQTFSPTHKHYSMYEQRKSRQNSGQKISKGLDESIINKFKLGINGTSQKKSQSSSSNKKNIKLDQQNDDHESPQFKKSQDSLDKYQLIEPKRGDKSFDRKKSSKQRIDIRVSSPNHSLGSQRQSSPSFLRSSHNPKSSSPCKSQSPSSSYRSRSGSRSRSKSHGSDYNSKKNPFIQSNSRTQTQKRKSSILKKATIIDQLLYNDIKQREEKLAEEYQNLEALDSQRPRKSKQKPSPSKVYQAAESRQIRNRRKVTPQRYDERFSPFKLASIAAYDSRLRTASDYVSSRQNQSIPILSSRQAQAVNQSLKLANSNYVKQEKYIHYDHYTHKRHFNYTSQDPHTRQQPIKPYDNIKVLSKQTSFNRTPQKTPAYEASQYINSTNRTVRREQVDRVVGRLYPNHASSRYEISSQRPQKLYDSTYEQTRQLNAYGKTLHDERNDRKQMNDYVGRYGYGKEFKASVIRNNAVGR